MELNEKIHDLAAAALTNESQFVVDVIFSGINSPIKKVVVILDGDNGVTIDDCANVSRQVANTLDELNLIEDRYMLEVSTPGLDHPLKLTRQYIKNVGRRLKVHLKNKSIIEGRLAGATELQITLDQEVKGEKKKIAIKTIEVPYTEIEKAFVLVSFK
jgi:ribosome maturation factor RimP